MHFVVWMILARYTANIYLLGITAIHTAVLRQNLQAVREVICKYQYSNSHLKMSIIFEQSSAL